MGSSVRGLRAQKRQARFLSCPAHEVLYGGARGGGKSWATLLDWLRHEAKYGGKSKGILFRRTMPELEDMLSKASEMFPSTGGVFKAQAKTWEWPSGAKLKFRYLERDTDADRYQGHEYNWMAFEEAGNWPSPKPLDKLKACLRSADGVRHRLVLTANPGGVGHNWLKARFIDPVAPGKIQYLAGEWTRVYIPAKVTDNPALLKADPGYIERIKEAAGSQAMLKAWLDGSWDIVAGGMFDDVYDADRHSIAPFDIPLGWRIDRSFDWGSSKPFSVGFWAESDGTEATMPDGTRKAFPRGTLFRIAEIYGWNGQPNEGCRKLAVEVARDIVAFQKDVPWGHRVVPGPADNSIFDAENGVCIADDMAKLGVRWERSDKSPGSRKTGWEAMRKLFKACKTSPMEDPGLFVFDTCRHFIRTVPTLPRDANKTDDVDTHAEDHCLDGETMVDTEFGPTAIKNLVGRSGRVYSSDGELHEFFNCRCTKRRADVVRICFENGAEMVCTPDHRVLTKNNGWVEAKDLADETGYCIIVPGDTPCSSKSSATPFKNSLGNGFTHVATTSNMPGNDFTAPFGSMSTKSQPLMVIPSTTLTTTDQTTSPRTSHLCQLANTSHITRSVVWNFAWSLSKKLKCVLRCGMGAKQDGSGTKPSTKNTAAKLLPGRSLKSASSVGHRSTGLSVENFVQTHVSRHGEGLLGLILNRGSVLCVGQNSKSTSIGPTKPVADHAGGNWRVASVEQTAARDVYCLDVPSLHAFSVIGGLIVHNCADETRYRVLAVRKQSKVYALPF